jgi:hypothetical protein
MSSDLPLTNLPAHRLPDVDSPLVRQPTHVANPFPGQDRRPAHRITVLRGEDRWLWAHVLRAVGGWQVISSGVLSRTLFTDAEVAAEYVIRQFLGADGDGFDRLSHEAFSQLGRTAHIRYEAAPNDDRHGKAYCGADAAAPAVFDTSEPDHAEQHCIACDRAYRAQHYGRMPVTY